jgi:hypothetical protein
MVMACRQRNAVSGIFPVKPAPVECVPPLQLKENEKRKGGVARVRAFKHKNYNGKRDRGRKPKNMATAFALSTWASGRSSMRNPRLQA